jgi:hypothetical protein
MLLTAASAGVEAAGAVARALVRDVPDQLTGVGQPTMPVAVEDSAVPALLGARLFDCPFERAW